ncbi:hypothetical protein CAOG_04954 [Capsaspora owczarzaki ATCC 30864]|uniref:Uncharacterized protein n=1 Tax=Capsaspora owczarzaki (strain ATCC 30864) TaxID=595528 RepID=A0A0D2UGS0_CAPO3|nr:hypothetical protein CAOG_04954 [Capsaspora owczarzaki ATCC 30864]KJE94286.1 hypothetical protein CAOG_004954 [Capsaspora owczarzaki ATCC 30864]|eukprot:XP_004347705.1 hypothetical protein CAOG_04954 [Capsaspora owczarzaki ATCC 30864]
MRSRQSRLGTGLLAVALVLVVISTAQPANGLPVVSDLLSLLGLGGGKQPSQGSQPAGGLPIVSDLLSLLGLGGKRPSQSTVIGCKPQNCSAIREPFETLCDGLDNDCDGNIDLLLPVPENVCNTGLKGVCATGYAQCHPDRSGVKLCLGPSPRPETYNGLDDDCDGIVDNVKPIVAAGISARIALFAFDGVDPSSPSGYRMVLDQRGLPYDLISGTAAIDLALVSLRAKYSLVILPPGWTSAWLTNTRRAYLELFANAGGIVFAFLPDNGATANAFCGLSSAAVSTSVTYMRTSSTSSSAGAAILAHLDTFEETNLLINAFTGAGDSQVLHASVVLNPILGVNVLMNVFTGASGNSLLGAGLTRRTVGSGAIYAFGHDMIFFLGLQVLH